MGHKINNRVKQTLEIVERYTKGKDILDIGCLNHELNRFECDRLHAELCKISKSCLGIDFEKEVLKLKEQGYNVIWCDALKMNLGRKFDIVIAADFIEHIYNHEKFLEVVKNHLADDGYLILTTPNCFYYKHILDIALTGKVKISKYNYCYFYPESLTKLLNDNGFEVVEFHWLNMASKRSIGYIPVFFRKALSSTFMIISKKIHI